MHHIGFENFAQVKRILFEFDIFQIQLNSKQSERISEDDCQYKKFSMTH